MKSLGVDEVYIAGTSGENTDRPELKKMVDYVWKEGRYCNNGIIQSLCTQHLGSAGTVTEKRVEFVSQRGAIDISMSPGKFVLTVSRDMTALEREYIL